MTGLRGTYEESCIVCMQGTDTGLAFVGWAEVAIAGLVALGVPVDEAGPMVSEFTGSPPGEVPIGTITIPVRVCEACADKVRLPVALIASGTLPRIEMPSGYELPEGEEESS
jgi:hypothetical protein